MTRVPPLNLGDLESLQETFAKTEQLLGFVPESVLTMAYRPRMAELMNELAMEVLGPGSVDQELKGLVSEVASLTAGCRYCQAHTAGYTFGAAGASIDKVQATFQADTSDLFTEAERAAIDLAQCAAAVPNRVTDAHFDRLREYFSNEQIVELVSVIALFGWLNRWNDTMATTLEPMVLPWAKENLSQVGWEAGSHAPPET